MTFALFVADMAIQTLLTQTELDVVDSTVGMPSHVWLSKTRPLVFFPYLPIGVE